MSRGDQILAQVSGTPVTNGHGLHTPSAGSAPSPSAGSAPSAGPAQRQTSQEQERAEARAASQSVLFDEDLLLHRRSSDFLTGLERLSENDPRRAARSSAFGTPSSRVERRQQRRMPGPSLSPMQDSAMLADQMNTSNEQDPRAHISLHSDGTMSGGLHDSAIRADELNTSNERDQRALRRHQRALQRDQSTM
jgi:hypothetical protein